MSLTNSSSCVTTHRHIHCLGKSFFLNFVLAWLLSANQVVLLSVQTTLYLFYNGKTYARNPISFSRLPRHKRDTEWPIWTLIDAYGDHGPPINSQHNIWPIQVSSPHPTRWKMWRKQLDAAVLGMPLWDTEELMQGYVTAFCHLPRPCRLVGVVR